MKERPRASRYLALALFAALACSVFLGCLGSVDLWGKREKRAAAEALDTIEHNHWLVAQIQGRPRLEKPPLPRWVIAALMLLNGRRDEWLVRLPSAISALATVALIYATGRRIGGRRGGISVGACSLFHGILRGRAASGDERRAARAVHDVRACAAWWRLHDDDGALRVVNESRSLESGWERTRSTAWLMAFHVALGLGFLTKSPVILLLVAATVIPYLAFSRRLVYGLRRLAGVWGLLLFAARPELASCRLAVRSERPRVCGCSKSRRRRVYRTSSSIAATTHSYGSGLAWCSPGRSSPRSACCCRSSV